QAREMKRPMKVVKDGNRPARDHLPKPRILPRGTRTQQPHAQADRTQYKTRWCEPRRLCHSGFMAKKKIGRPNEERRARQLLATTATRKAAAKKAAGDAPGPSEPGSELPKKN